MASASWDYPFSYSVDPCVDLSSQDAFKQGAPLLTLQRMRENDPIAWCEESEGPGFWSVTRHADIMSLNRDPATLSSAQGIRIENQTESEFEARKTFQETDPPEHSHMRMLLNEAFSKRSIARFENQIRGVTRELISAALEQELIDATDWIARPLPMQMLGQIIGIPNDDLEWLVEKGDALISNADPDYTDHVVDKVNTDEYRFLPFRSPAAVELFDYANYLLDRIRRGERAGVLNLVLQPNKEGKVLSDAEFRNLFCLIVAAGNDTTRYSIAAALHALANQPCLLEQLRNGTPETFTTAVDELIRWASPTTHFRRTATRDFTLHGRNIREGDKVVLWFLSGNRDRRVFADPDEINLTRKPNRFMSFGQGGPHVCLGMFLAKLEVRIVLEEVAKSVGTIRQLGPHSFLRSNFILGIKRLPLAFTPRKTQCKGEQKW